MKKSSLRTLSLVMTLVLVVLTIAAGCGAPVAPPTPNPTVAAVQTQAAAQPVTEAEQVLACNGQKLGDPNLKATIEVWSWASEALSVVMPGFQKLYPNVEVKFVNLDSAVMHDKVSVAIAAGSGFPDVFSIQGSELQRFIKAGGMLDLTDTVQPCVKDFPAYKVAEATGPDGHIYALPWDMGPMGLYYRADLWKEKGFEAPKTWDEYIEQGAAFAKEGHSMIEMPKGGSSYYFDTLLQQLGGSYFDAEGNVTVDNELGLQAMQTVKKMYDAGITADISQWSPGWYTGWKEGTIVSNWGAAWMGHVFPDNIKEGEPTFGQWRIAPLPAFAEGGATSSNQGGSNLAIPAGVKNKEAAVAFATYAVASLEGQVMGTLAGNISAYLPAIRDPRVVNATNAMYGDQKYFALFADLSEQVPTDFIRAAPYNESSAVIGEATAKVMAGELSAEEAMKQAGDKIREIAAKYK